jgi:amino acid adenylation domain-containing protein
MDRNLLQDYLEPWSAYPERVAVTDGRRAITYGELTESSSRLAGLLVECNVGRGDRVAVCTRRSPDYLWAILGIIRAGAAYVPLDPKAPPERWRKIVDDCAPSALVGDLSSIQAIMAAGLTALPKILLAPRSKLHDDGMVVAADLEDILAAPAVPPVCGNTSEDLAYILYTSGSTGVPKGVMITHGNVCNYISWAVESFAIRTEDRILGTAPFHFDMSTFDVWCALKTGATLCLADESLTLFPERLLGFMEAERVTIWKGISSLLLYLERAGCLGPGRIPTLNRILFGGEALPARSLIRWMDSFPNKFFYNVYGPTEATGISLYYPVETVPGGPGERIPIGRPCKGMKAILLDEKQMAVREGTTGELYLAGPGLGAGYLNDPDRTAGSFIPLSLDGGSTETWYRTGDIAFLRPDGNFEFVGRKDHQVKIMGYRIELGEIEQALHAIEGIREAAVIAADRDGVAELVAFVHGEGAGDAARILSGLRDRLPGYMLPRRLFQTDSLPRCGRGKIDRTALQRLVMEARNATG